MGVYKIPCGIIEDISSMTAKFWWGNSGTTRKVYWRSWQSMCAPKCLGGLGFRDMAVFNEALLGRQVWRLITYPESLFGRVMRNKYYPNKNFLDSALGLSSSYSWKSIWGSKSLVKEGLMWRVGDGSNINIWEDNWVADDQGRCILTPKSDEVNRVCDLINFSIMEWDHELIVRIFNERDANCILAIPLSIRAPQDSLKWALSKDGKYTVKTAYMLGKSCNFDNFHHAWVNLWKLQTTPKVRHFLWRVCTASLPVRALLKTRHMLDSDDCPRCNNIPETLCHALFFCPSVSDLWINSGCEELKGKEEFLDFKNLFESWSGKLEKLQQKGAALMWYIWNSRNEWVFNNKETSNHLVLTRTNRLIEDFDKYQNKIYGTKNKTQWNSSNKWQAPPLGFAKINCDASLCDDGWIGVGAVARNSDGDVLFAGVRRVRGRWPPEVAECKAILYGVQLAKRYGAAKVILETDCQAIVSRLTKTTTYYADLDYMLEDVLSVSSSLDYTAWSHVKREGNYVAHHLARIVPFGVEQVWENNSPTEISPYVIMDKLSFE